MASPKSYFSSRVDRTVNWSFEGGSGRYGEPHRREYAVTARAVDQELIAAHIYSAKTMSVKQSTSLVSVYAVVSNRGGWMEAGRGSKSIGRVCFSVRSASYSFIFSMSLASALGAR